MNQTPGEERDEQDWLYLRAHYYRRKNAPVGKENLTILRLHMPNLRHAQLPFETVMHFEQE